MTHKTHYTHIVILAAVLGGVALALALLYPQLGKAQDFPPACASITSTKVTIGNQISTQLLATSSRRAWARIQMPAIASSTAYLALNKDAAAVVGAGTALNASASSTDFMDSGLATLNPYTGAIEGITNAGSTTVQVDQCSY